jgi:hypothetical protein
MIAGALAVSGALPVEMHRQVGNLDVRSYDRIDGRPARIEIVRRDTGNTLSFEFPSAAGIADIVPIAPGRVLVKGTSREPQHTAADVFAVFDIDRN